MDVSQGLISKLVKCKSIKNALTPISSQISLLIIIVEQQDRTGYTHKKDNINTLGSPILDATSCATQLSEAVAHLVRAGERQSQGSKDEEFVKQMSSACESLTVACNQLTILAQRFNSAGVTTTSAGGVKGSLCQAAKDVLQGVLKIFLVIDDYHVRQILGKVDFVLRNVTDVLKASKSELVEAFKSLTFSVLALKAELKKRCSNLLSRACRDQILVWSGVLQNSVASLSLATQTRLKYKDNLAAKASQESVEREMKEACQKIRQLLLTGPQDELDDDLVSFVGLVDSVMESLSETNRRTLSSEVDSNITSLVQHSMGVAHLASGSYRDLVVACCHRILQAKFRLFDLDASLREGQAQNAIRVDFDNTCEMLLDETCDLERQVNMTLLQLIVHTFLCPEEELRPLRNIARRRVKEEPNGHVQTVERFIEFSESLCQVSLLVAASSTDSSKVREIVTSVRRLESIEADIGPAVLLTTTPSATDPTAANLDLMLDWWGREVRTILTTVDAVVDPRVFMDMTESIMEGELERFADLIGSTRDELCSRFYRLRHLAQRPAQVARRLQDDSSDALYRNGLGVFIQLLTQRIAEATETFQDIVTHEPEINPSGEEAHLPPTPRQVDTLHRRLCLVKKAVGTLRDGLNMRKHPGIMSEHRMMLLSQRPVEVVHERIKLKKEKEDNRIKALEAQMEEMRKRKKEEKDQEVPAPISSADSITQAPSVSENNSDSELSINTNSVIAPTAKVVSLPKPDKHSVEHAQQFPVEFGDKEREGGSASEIYKLVRKLVTSAAEHDTRAVEHMTHGILSWTNHIIENAGVLLAHCPRVAKEGDLRSLIKEIDSVAPTVIQQARFVCAGDDQGVYTLTTDASRWASKLNSARVIVDVAADRWLVLTSDLRELTQGRDQHKLKVAVAAITSAQKEMSALLLKTRFLTGNYLRDGSQKIQFLTDSHAEIENLAVTIQTAVDVAAVSDSQSEETWWQLGIACRDWAVMMTSVAAELDNISDVMGSLASLRIPGLAPLAVDEAAGDVVNGAERLEMKGMRLADVVERETDSILELVDCVVTRDETLKARSDSLVYDLQAALTDIFSVARQPVTMNKTALHALLCRLRIGLAKSRWVEKALEIQDLIRNSCFLYMGFARTLLLDAQDLSIKEETEGSIKVSKARHGKSVEFLEKSSALKQRTLRAIQLCPELTRRAVVRSTLDGLAKLTTEIGNVMRAPGRIPDSKVSSLTQQWGARMKKLLSSLANMDEVKPAVISEIEKFNRGSKSEFSRQADEFLPSQTQSPYHPRQEERQKESLPQQGNASPYHPSLSPHQQNTYHQEPHFQQNPSNTQPHYQPYQQQQQRYQSERQQEQQHQNSFQQQPQFQQQPTSHKQPYQSRPPQQPQQYQSQLPYQPQPQQQQQQGYQSPSQQQHFQPQPSNAQQPYQSQQQQGYQAQRPQPQQQNHQHLHRQGFTNEPLQPRHQELWERHNQPTQQPEYHQPSYPLSSQQNGQSLTANGGNRENTVFSGTEGQQISEKTNPVQATLISAQDLGIHLKRWGAENVRHLRPVQASLEVAKLCSEMAMYTRGQGIFKSSAEVVQAAEKITNLCREVETFGQRLVTLTAQGRTRDHLQVCLNKLHGCTSQLHIIATAANNSARSHESDRILVRNASNVLTTLKQFFTAVESLSAKGVHAALPDADTTNAAGDPLTQQAVELLVTLKAETDRYLAEDRQSGSTDILGLHRMELHRPPSLASLLDIDLEDDSSDKKETSLNPITSNGNSPVKKCMISPKPTQTNNEDPVNSTGPTEKDDSTPNKKNFTPQRNVAFGDKFEEPPHKSKPKDPPKELSLAFSNRRSAETHTPGDSAVKSGQAEKIEKGQGLPSTEGVDEKLIERVLSPNSEPDIDRLLFKLDEAIEGRWVGSGVKSPPPASLAPPPAPLAPSTAPLAPPPAPLAPPPAPLAPPLSHFDNQGLPVAPPSQEVAINKWSQGENKFQTTEKGYHDGEEATLYIRKKNNGPSLPEDKTHFGLVDHPISHNLNSPETQDESSAKNRYYKSKYKTPVRSYKPLKHKSQSQKKPSEDRNLHDNQSEDDWDSVVGGASVDSFLLQSEDVFGEPTRGAVQYHSDEETGRVSLGQDPLSSGKNYDSGSEAGLVSAASFLLSHEDVFSKKKETWDTHF